jgi:hypothetical protein
MSTRSLLGGKGRSAHKADNLAAICESIVYKMWKSRLLTNLWASMGCYRDSFNIFTTKIMIIIIIMLMEIQFYIKHSACTAAENSRSNNVIMMTVIIRIQ